MTLSGNPSRLGSLILLWLLTQSKAKRTRNELLKALSPLLVHQRSDGEQREAVDGEISALEQAGLLQRVNRSGLAATEEGKRAGLAVLGLTALPPRTTWATIKGKYLVALFLGSSLPLPTKAAERLNESGGLRAALLVRQYDLKTKEYPTYKQAKDALGWKQLGVPDTDQPFEKEPVLRFLLRPLLDTKRELSSDEIIEQLTAQSVGASRSDAGQVRLSAQRRWLDGQDLAGSPPDARPDEPPEVATARNTDLTDDKAFAERVLAAARASKSGRFGDNKVFISHVFQHLKNEGALSGDLAAFKARLGAAHFSGLLSLSRADLVEAMAPADVDASETQHQHATFHFVRI